MDSFEWNKIIGAILGTVLFVMGVGFLAEVIYEPIEDNRVGYALPMPEGDGDGGGEAVEEEIIPIGVLLASASVEDGAKVLRKCAACHNFDAGGANKAGPGLYDIVGRTIGSYDGYGYSDVLNELNAAGETWTYDSLNAWLADPKKFASGTKMVLKLTSEKERVNLMAYLQTLSDNPVPFPVVEEPVVAEAETADGDSMAGEAEPMAATEPMVEEAEPMDAEKPMDETMEMEKPAMEDHGEGDHSDTEAAPAAQ